MIGVRTTIARQVRGLLNDGSTPPTRIARDGSGLFAPDAICWRVHGDVTTMMIGGIAALLLQMLHPAVLAGVWDHSTFREDMTGRLRGTARFIAQTTFATRADAEAQIARVRAIHDRVSGILPDGTAYSASDPHLLAWVHVSEASMFLAAWRRYAEPAMMTADIDRYFAEIAVVGRALGADPVPSDAAGTEAWMQAMRPELRVDSRTREVAWVLMAHRPPNLAMLPFEALTMRAAIALLPGWARRMHGFSSPVLAAPFLHAGTAGIAHTLRWALRG